MARVVLLAMAAALLAGCDLATGPCGPRPSSRRPAFVTRTSTTTGARPPSTYDADPNPLEARAEQDQAAAIIWSNLPFRIDRSP